MRIGTRLVWGAGVVAVALAITTTPGTATAQFDHLKCYKSKDQKTFKKAAADFTALQTQFGVAENCQIKPAAKLFCVPVTKNVTSIEEGVDAPFPAEELTFDRLCYKITCPKVTLAAEQVSDQFGNRTIDKLKAVMVCTPAVKGPPPTTSSTMLGGCIDNDLDGFGDGCVAGPDCDDADNSINPNAVELCDGVDNDCDTVADSPCGGGPGCCSGLCVDTVSDPNNCGGCATACPSGPNASPLCITGTCFTECDLGFGDCNLVAIDGCEVGLTTDVNNCGICGSVCPPATNASPVCSAGSCSIDCYAGAADCNGIAADGCEVSLLSDPDNCGSCGLVCPSVANSTRVCSVGTCSKVCNVGFADCNGILADGCEINLLSNASNCGTCGNACAIGESCVSGICTP